MALAQADVNRIVQATIAKATEINLEISVAVCDSGGHLLAFNRTQGAIWISAPVAQGKAGAASAFGRPSGSVPSDSPVMQTIVASQGGRILPAQGGLPLFRDGELIGAVGVSGGTGQEDEDCAQAGVAAFVDL